MKKITKKLAGWAIVAAFGFIPFQLAVKDGTPISVSLELYGLTILALCAFVQAIIWIMEE